MTHPAPWASSPSALSIPRWTVRLLAFGTRRWLLLFVAVVGLYVASAVLAPWAMVMGWEKTAQGLYRLHAPTCHQRPADSFFLFGPEALARRGRAVVADLGTDARRREFLGTRALGFKTAMCQRTLAIYGSLALLGVIYMASARPRRAWPLWAGALLMAPMAWDGISQIIGLRESNLAWRTLTGLLFSLGAVASLMPRIDGAMQDVARQIGQGQRDLG